MTFKADLLPQTNLGYSLGSSSLKWKFVGDGSGITNISTLGLTRPKNLNGTNDVTIQTLINDNRANRLAFLPADQIIIEKTTDGGATWTDAGVADSTKTGLFSQTRSSVAIPLLNGNINIQCGIRITITAMKYNVPANTAETQKYNYWNSSYVLSAERYCQLKEMYFWVSSLNNAIKLKVERATGANPNNWATIFENNSFGLTGWSGNDYISFPQSTFGGGTTQTGNYWNYRLTFFTIGPNGSSTLTSGYLTSAQSVAEIRGYGDTWWTPGSNLASKDHMYSWDYQQNVTFPKGVTATTFNGSLNGNASTATKLSTSGTTSQFWRGDNSWSNSLANYIFNTTDISETAANLSGTASNHSINFYRNGLTIPYQMDNTNDGGLLRVRGTSETTTIFELGTWDDSGSGETIQFNYYPTTSRATPTYSVSVPKATGTICLTNHDHDSAYLKLSGGTMTGTINLASAGLKTSSDHGYITDAAGNFTHTNTATNQYWHLNSYDGTTKFKFIWETGETTISGNVTAFKFIGPLQGNADSATKLGSTTVGSAVRPIYLNAGAPTVGRYIYIQ